MAVEQERKVIKADDILEEIDFGVIVKSLLDTPTVTDIKIWDNEILVTDNDKGAYRLDFSKYDEKDVEVAKNLASDLPRKIAVRMKVNYNNSKAILDGEMKYGEKGILRFNAIHGALTFGDIPAVAIRNTRFDLSLNKDVILEQNYADENILALLGRATRNRCNIIVAGQTGAGKTTLLRYLAVSYIKPIDSIITIEDTYEAYLKMLKPNMRVLALKSNDRYSFSDLLKTSLRQDPDWILISESRDESVIDMLNASSTGHSIITTVHAAGAMEIPDRIVEMSKCVGSDAERIYRQFHRNFDIGIFINYDNDSHRSRRQIVEICEYYADDHGNPKQHMIYKLQDGKYVANKIESTRLRRKLGTSLESEQIQNLIKGGLL